MPGAKNEVSSDRAMSMDELRTLFPALSRDAVETSPQDDSYNCVAWAGGDTERSWWPASFPTHGTHWPIPATDETVEGFVEAFRALGYEACDDGSLEKGFEKVALYVDAEGQPTHLVRQLSSGKWTSKMGRLEDIEHQSTEELCGRSYGVVERYMKRRA